MANVRRVGGKEPDDQAAIMAARRAEAATQAMEQRRLWTEDLVRLAKGVTLWEKHGWLWEEPAPDSKPEDWPPLAKLLWLFVRTDRRLYQISGLTKMGHAPARCNECGLMDRGYQPMWCEDHAAPHDARNALWMASSLFLTPMPE